MKIRTALFAATLCSAATFAAPVKFEIDPTHFYVQISA